MGMTYWYDEDFSVRFSRLILRNPASLIEYEIWSTEYSSCMEKKLIPLRDLIKQETVATDKKN